MIPETINKTGPKFIDFGIPNRLSIVSMSVRNGINVLNITKYRRPFCYLLVSFPLVDVMTITFFSN